MVKLTVEFTDDAAEIVHDLAINRCTTVPEIIRRSINLMKFVSKECKEGAKLLVQSKDGETREIAEF